MRRQPTLGTGAALFGLAATLLLTAPPATATPAAAVIDPSAAVLVQEWGVTGDGPGQLDQASDLTVDPTGDVLVANTGNDVVSRFSADGTFESEFVAPEVEVIDAAANGDLVTAQLSGYDRILHWVSPVGSVALRASTGRVNWSTSPLYGIVNDAAAGQDGSAWWVRWAFNDCWEGGCYINVDGRAGRYSAAFGAPAGEFTATRGSVAVHDATDRVYVAGYGVTVYTRGGQYVRRLLQGQMGPIDTDDAGRVYVVVDRSGGLPLVDVVDPATGSVLAQWEVPAADSIAVAPDGTVYVLESAAGRVRRYGFPLTGVVTDQVSAAPVEGAWVVAIDPANGATTATTTDAAGRYTMAPGLGPRLIEFIDPSGHHTGEWHTDRALTDIPHADPVTIQAASPNIVDASLAPAGRTAGVAGTVLGSGGAPLGGVFVGAWDVAAGRLAGGATTAGDGTYEVTGLGAGPHLVVFLDVAGAHRYEYFDDATTPAGAQVLALQAGQTTLADAALAAAPPVGTGAHLAGTLTGAGDPIEHGLVVALNAADFSVARSGLTDAAGNFDIAVPAGNYRVEVVDPSGAHAGEWYDNRPLSDLAGASPVSVGPGETADLDADLAPTGPTGRIAGTVTGTGAELAQGGWVAVLGASDFAFAGGATVDAEGGYVVEGLEAGQYLVIFFDPANGYEWEWYDNEPGPGSATVVPVTAGATNTVDAVLSPTP